MRKFLQDQGGRPAMAAIFLGHLIRPADASIPFFFSAILFKSKFTHENSLIKYGGKYLSASSVN